jgi:hypothetical protein
MIEYGMFPEYWMTHQPAEDMIRTNNSWFYSTQWTQWIEPATKEINQVRNDFGYLNGLLVTAHDLITPDVHRVRYEDGSEMLVNHSSEGYSGPEGSLAGYSYRLTKGTTR